ncbi:zinc knuckle CX2CX4HX4C containing protein [Tanacetum coccineum]
MADNTKCTPKGIVENLLVKIDKFIFPIDFVILDMVEDFRMPIILGRPLLATTHAKVDIFKKSISLEVENEKVIFKMRSSFTTTIFESIHAIRSEISIGDDNLMNIDCDLFLYESESCEFNHLLAIDPDIFTYEIDVQESYEEDPEECEEDKANAVIGVVQDKLNDDWFSGTSEDEDDLEGIIDYLEPKSYKGFIDLNDEAYNERKYKLLGITYRKPSPILIKKVKVIRYTIGPGETYTKIRVIGIDEMPITRDNVATIRARLMKEMAKDESGQAKTKNMSTRGIRARDAGFARGKQAYKELQGQLRRNYPIGVTP